LEAIELARYPHLLGKKFANEDFDLSGMSLSDPYFICQRIIYPASLAGAEEREGVDFVQEVIKEHIQYAKDHGRPAGSYEHNVGGGDWSYETNTLTHEYIEIDGKFQLL
jgi:hypothetical protein